ncbi:MAG: NYN domain-containing protein [Phycisphaerae bacterium]|nr:NYN domain-containing protein [Gemmatimonadaceae bacterium]
MLIDFDNVTMGIRSDLELGLKNLLASDVIKGKVSVRRAYADWRRYPQYIVPLTESSIDLIFAPAYGSAKKNATDIRLAIDALELVFTRPEIGTFVLLSGDSDFSSMVIKLKEYGKYVIGVGIRESASELLVMNCDEYYSYNHLAGFTKAGEDETTRWDPWELVTESISRMKRNGDVMRSDRLKQVMQEIDSSFDEKNLGMSKFSRFVQDAAQRGLLRTTKLENGQLEVDVPPASSGVSTSGAHAAVAGAAQPEFAAEDGEFVAPAEVRRERPDRDRDGRGRRGRRGRGRDREPREGETREADAVPVERTTGEFATQAAPVVPAPPIGRAAFTPVFTPMVTQPVAAPVAAPAAPLSAFGDTASDHIGRSGEKLTRSEAFDLVKRSVEALVSGEETTTASAVRRKAYEILGRDSDSLSARNFERMLRDSHDADMIDLRRRGHDFEVARAAAAAPIVDQLQSADQALKAAAAANAPPPPPRGMAHRGVGSRGRGGRGPSAPIDPSLLMVGMVGAPSRPPVAPAAPVVEAPAVPAVMAPEPAAPVTAAADAAPARSNGRGGRPDGKGAGRGAKPAAKPVEKVAEKPAAKAPAKAAAKSPARPAAKAVVPVESKPAAKKAAPAKAPAKKAAKAAKKG